jgi:hypothetical protein
LDLNRLLELPQFESITKTEPEKSVKPVIICTVNGGPDENPRYQKVIAVAIHQFLTHNLNALFVVTNTPGRSAYNCVRRKMTMMTMMKYTRREMYFSPVLGLGKKMGIKNTFLSAYTQDNAKFLPV